MEKTALQAQILANRIKKRLKHLQKWAKRSNFEAFRLYDRDIPEIPLVLDLYGDLICGALYKRPYEKDPAEEAIWLEAMRSSLSQSLRIAPEKIIIKQRERQRDNGQYEKLARRGLTREIREGSLKFKVNLSDYLDTGLFLDRRDLRAMVGADAKGRRVLNLFCYTGSFSVYAAAGGAVSTDSVDLSNTYLAWARENFALNSLKAERLRHEEFFAQGCGKFANGVINNAHSDNNGKTAVRVILSATSDKYHTVSDNNNTGSDTGGANHTSSDNIYTISDNNHTAGDKKQSSSDSYHTASDTNQSNSDNIHAASDTNRLIRADVGAFLDRAIAERYRWDSIILDPPAFSNSAMVRADFDLSKDWPALLAKCLTLLSPAGKLWFSASARSFRASASDIEMTLNAQFPGVKAEDISGKVVGEDFKGKKGPKTFLIGTGD